ncbi:FkbM family methyltransferase [Rubellicoccus peritrichatus]|uniref:FkbM family methyltransferase n=1 Tax=Rubellicoccus peritrichatus TaxID=3080537 RepID=A0AAQ3QWN6_9BACT|nr:FkbM family methyltransferase [Puniceicoccus sp. CR14]WOO42918.1 FkbM family methyltransferase [Puniceicoccus sp. CR14]
MIKKLLSTVCLAFFGRKNYYRFARFLWIDARRDAANAMSSNGEFLLQQKIVNLAKSHQNPVMFDIGANVGAYSERFLLNAMSEGLAEQMKLYCFEPNPNCVAEIEKRFSKISNSSCATIIQQVITDKPGRISFYITGETAGSSSLRIDGKTQDATPIEVECVTLDAFCVEHRISNILFAKVDTEGNDMRVLEGAKQLLEEGRIQYLQFEYNHRWILFRNFLKDVFDLIEPMGYQVAKVTGKGLEVYPHWHFELEVFWEGNYLIGKDFAQLGLVELKSAIV